MRQWLLSPLQSRHLGTSHNSPNCHQLPCRIFLNFINGLKSLSFQRRFYFWGKPEVAGCQIWAVGVLSHLGDLMFRQKNCRRHDAWAGALLWWSCQSPAAHSCGLLNHPNSFHGGMYKLNTKLDADSLLYSLRHFECDGCTVHMLIQGHLPPPLTSTVKSSLFTHAQSSPLSLAARLHQCDANYFCYNNNGWTFSSQTSYIPLLLLGYNLVHHVTVLNTVDNCNTMIFVHLNIIK